MDIDKVIKEIGHWKAESDKAFKEGNIQRVYILEERIINIKNEFRESQNKKC